MSLVNQQHLLNYARVIDETRRLVDKFPGGYEEWASGRSEVCRLDEPGT